MGTSYVWMPVKDIRELEWLLSSDCLSRKQKK